MIITDRLKLREWEDVDTSALAAIHADQDVMQLLGGVKTHEETAEVVAELRRRSASGEPIFWAVERLNDGAFLGAAGLTRLGPEYPFGPAVEVGWRLGRSFWGQGYASEAGTAALDHAFGQLRFDQVFALTVPANERSQAVMRRIGMTKVEGGDFDHPHLPITHGLSRHLLYVAEAQSWSAPGCDP